MAAGLGSRFGGLKQLAQFGKNGETLLDYSIYDAIQAGFNHVVFIIRKEIESDFKLVLGNRIEKQIKVDYVFQELDNLPANYTYSNDRTKPWGTGHAVLMAKEVINNPFVVINGDDYYGRDAFLKASDSLSQMNSNEFIMIGYTLKNTLTDSGGVSRGICEISENQNLLAVNETHDVAVIENTTLITGKRNGERFQFSGDETVSMNFFGLHPNFFSQLEDAFKTFLNKHGSEEKSEFYLPFVLTDLIQSQELKIQVIPTSAHWFGVTYVEDAAIVQKKLNNLTQTGSYPENLWE